MAGVTTGSSPPAIASTGTAIPETVRTESGRAARPACTATKASLVTVKDYKIISEGKTLLLRGIEHAFLLDLAPFEVQISDPLPPSVAPGSTLFLHANLRVCIDSDVKALALAAAHFEGLNTAQIAKMVSKHLAAQPLAVEALPATLSDLSDPTLSGERLTAFWSESLAHLGMKAVKYEFTGITNSEEILPHTPYTGEDAVSNFCRFLDFEQRHEHFDIVVSNHARYHYDICLNWTIVAKINPTPQGLVRAASTFLGKDSDDIKTMITDELVRLVDSALLTSGTYGMLAHVEREAEKIGLGNPKNTKQYGLRVLNTLAEQSLTWRGKLSFIRFVLSGLKVAQQLHSQFLRNSRAKFSEWGLELVEISLGSLD